MNIIKIVPQPCSVHIMPFHLLHIGVLTTLLKMGCFRQLFGVLNVHSSTTPNRVFLKSLFEGVNGHLQNTLTSGSETLKAVLCKCFHILFSTP